MCGIVLHFLLLSSTGFIFPSFFIHHSLFQSICRLFSTSVSLSLCIALSFSLQHTQYLIFSLPPTPSFIIPPLIHSPVCLLSCFIVYSPTSHFILSVRLSHISIFSVSCKYHATWGYRGYRCPMRKHCPTPPHTHTVQPPPVSSDTPSPHTHTHCTDTHTHTPAPPPLPHSSSSRRAGLQQFYERHGCTMIPFPLSQPRAVSLTNIPVAAFLSRTASRRGASPGERCRAAAAAEEEEGEEEAVAAAAIVNNPRCRSRQLTLC